MNEAQGERVGVVETKGAELFSFVSRSAESEATDSFEQLNGHAANRDSSEHTRTEVAFCKRVESA